MVAAGVESVRLSFYWAHAALPVAGRRCRRRRPNASSDGAGVPTDFGAPTGSCGWLRRAGCRCCRGAAAPAWAARFPGEFASPPADHGRYAGFVRALAERYGERGSFWRERRRCAAQPLTEWQLWNEPTMQSFWLVQPFAREYVALLRATRRALRQAAPRARIVLAGLVYESWDALEQIYRAGGRRWFDAVALHPFTRRPDDVLRILERNRTVMARHADAYKPLYLTELSWPSSRGRSLCATAMRPMSMARPAG